MDGKAERIGSISFDTWGVGDDYFRDLFPCLNAYIVDIWGELHIEAIWWSKKGASVSGPIDTYLQ